MGGQHDQQGHDENYEMIKILQYLEQPKKCLR